MKIPSRFVLWVIMTLIVLFGVFVLPWYIPMAAPTSSYSYTYGFNNFAAWLCIAITLLALTLWGIWGPKTGETNRLDDVFTTLLTPPEQPEKDRSLLWAFGIVSGLVLFVIGWLCYKLPFAYFNESRYFISRLDQMILGMRPYSDFEFVYGPGMLFPTFWLYQSSFFSVEQAYYTTLLIQWAAGLFCLYSICRLLGGKFARATVFIAIASTAFNISLGMNYTPLRFALPLASILFFHRTVCKAVRQRERGLVPIGTAFFCTLLNFAISPEMGLAVALAISVYFIALLRTPERRLSVGLILIVAVPPITALLFSPDYFTGVFSFSKGGSNFPILPTIHILTFLGVIFLILPRLGIIGCKKNSVVGAAAAALCILIGLLIVPALGRCDGGHVFWNGMGALLLFLAVISLWKRDMFRACTLLYVVIFSLCLQYTTLRYYFPGIRQVVYTRIKLARLAQGLHRDEPAFPTELSPIRYSKLLPFPKELTSLLQFKSLATPFGCDESLERFLKTTGRYVPEYYATGSSEISNKAAAERNAVDILKSEYLIIPSNAMGYLEVIDPKAIASKESAFLSKLFLFPINLTAKNRPFNPEREVYNLIAPHYAEIAQFGDYVIVRKIPAGR